MEICLALIAIILICFIVKKVTKNKKRPISILLIIIGVIVVSAVGIGFVKFSNDEQYVVVNENNQEVSIKLKNHKDYLGYKFYRFSSFDSEESVLKELKENGYNAYYDEDTKKILIEYKNDTFEIKKEKSEKLLFVNRYSYIFCKNNGH
ncbi:MAG: hypothetical protein UCH84_00925 [Eubacterium sp.]|nr:hypothetical protein [Eubacterium sp.]